MRVSTRWEYRNRFRSLPRRGTDFTAHGGGKKQAEETESPTLAEQWMRSGSTSPTERVVTSAADLLRVQEDLAREGTHARTEP